MFITLPAWIKRAPMLLFFCCLTSAAGWPAWAAQPGSGTTITVNNGHACTVTGAGGAACWGYNVLGQVGDGTATDRFTPVAVVGLSSGVAAISAGTFHTCALTISGGVKCWGDATYGQVGDGTTGEASTQKRKTPVDVVGMASGIIAVSSGESHSCALTEGGGVKCWGRNQFGQLGDGSTTQSLVPVDVVGLSSGVIGVSAGRYHSCALTSDGGVKCWGSDTDGKLGDGMPALKQTTPVDVSGLSSGVSAITAGDTHSCALTDQGAVKCWGSNSNGQLGDGTTTTRLTPVDVIGLVRGVKAISARGLNACALTASDGVKCWGSNIIGQLTDGTKIDRSTPVDVVGLSSGVAAISTGGGSNCVVMLAGSVKCWGSNYFGGLGDGTTTDRLTPGDVVGISSLVSSPPAIGAIAGLRTQPSILNLNAGNSATLLPDLVNVLTRQLNPGLTLMQQNQLGTVILDGFNGGRLAFMPVGYQAGDARASGVYPKSYGQYAVVAGGAAISIAPALVAVDQLASLLPGAGMNVSSSGVISATFNGAVYVVQPDVLVQSGNSGPARITGGSDGVFQFTDSAGNTQRLNPAVFEPDTVKTIVQTIYPTATLTLELDGTATVSVAGQRLFTLVPDMVLGAWPPERGNQAYWQEGPNRFRLVTPSLPGASQGFTVR